MKHCVLCGHAVGQGDRHARGNCPPRYNAGGEKARRKRVARRRLRREAEFTPKRGAAIAGTGVPKGD